MPLPERDTPERAIAEARIEQRLKDLAYFAFRKVGGDSSRVHILCNDEETGSRMAAFTKSQHIKGQGLKIMIESPGVVPSEVTVFDAIDILLETNPGMPMVCDNATLNELSGGSLQAIDEGHYRLTGRPGGDLEIYTPTPVVAS